VILFVFLYVVINVSLRVEFYTYVELNVVAIFCYAQARAVCAFTVYMFASFAMPCELVKHDIYVL
jgi:hypothetical protein